MTRFFCWLAAGSLAILTFGDHSARAAATGTTLKALTAEIQALKPARHTWREITWKTCPLEALREARERNRPVLTWVFLGNPSDERC